MTRVKLGLLIALGVLVAALAGWMYGWSSTSQLRTELESRRLRLELVQARMSILDARVDIYNVNFGNASRNLEYAKPPLTTARARLNTASRTELVAKIDAAITQAAEAQRLASKFSQDANSRAGDASRLIDEVLQATK